MPLPSELGSFDVVVSSFAIHHCAPERQRVLYGEVFGMLRPGGVFVNAEHVASPTARVVVTDASGKVDATGTGDGMIDAAIAAIGEATGVHGKLGNFQVSSVTGGADALGAVAVTVEAEGRKVTGRGVATDVVEASARAYLNAVNKIVRLRDRGPARDTTVGP